MRIKRIHLEIADPLKAHLEHVAVVVVVFDVEHWSRCRFRRSWRPPRHSNTVGAGDERRRHVEAESGHGLQFAADIKPPLSVIFLTDIRPPGSPAEITSSGTSKAQTGA